MKSINKLFTLIVLAAIPSLLAAQTEVNSVNGITWSLLPEWPNVSLSNVSACNSAGSPLTEGISTGVIKIDDNSVIAHVQIDAKDYGVVRLNKDLSTQWLTNISGYPISIGLFKGNVLAITATDRTTYGNFSNKYTGYMIDQKTGKILAQGNIYDGDEKYYQQPVFLYAPDGSSFKMALRKTNYTRAIHFSLPMVNVGKTAAEYFTNNDFQLITFDAQLNAKSTIKPVLPDGYFMGGTTNAKGDVFLMTDYSQGIIKIARYEDGQTSAAKVLQLPVTFGDDVISSLKNSYLFTSKTDPSVLFFAATYPSGRFERELLVSKFNFKTGVITRDVQVMDKDYFKNLEKSYVPFSKKFGDVNLGPTAEMRIKNIIENDGKLVVGLSSYRDAYDNVNTNEKIGSAAGAILINIYDEKSNLQHQQIIPRSYSAGNTKLMGIGMHCRDNVLYVTANNNKGLLGYNSVYCQVDLKTGSIINITGIEKTNIKKSYAADPPAAIWFDKQFVLSYLQEKGLFDSSADAHLQLLNY